VGLGDEVGRQRLRGAAAVVKVTTGNQTGALPLRQAPQRPGAAQTGRCSAVPSRADKDHYRLQPPGCSQLSARGATNGFESPFPPGSAQDGDEVTEGDGCEPAQHKRAGKQCRHR